MGEFSLLQKTLDNGKNLHFPGLDERLKIRYFYWFFKKY
jgi:hypothetical protein